MRTAWGLLVATAMLVLGDVAVAQEVAVLRLTGDGIPWNQLGRLDEVLHAAADSSSLTSSDAAGSASLNEVLLLIGCSTVTPECLTELALTLEVDVLLYGSVRRGATGNEVVLGAWDARVPAFAFNATLPVMPELESQLVPVVASLLDGYGVAQIVDDDPASQVRLWDGSLRATPLWVTGLSDSPQTVTVVRGDGREADLVLSATRAGVEVVSVDRFARRRGPAFTTAGNAGWVVLGSAVAPAAAAVALGVRTRSLQRDFAAEDRQRQARELADEGARSAELTNVMVGTACGLAALGAVLVATGVDRQRDAERAGTSGRDARVRVGVDRGLRLRF